MIGHFNWWTWQDFALRGKYYAILYFILFHFVLFFGWSYIAACRECRRLRQRKPEDLRENIARLARVTDELLNQDIRYERLYTAFGALSNELIGLCIWAKDMQNDYLFANRALRALLFNDISDAEMIGKDDYQIITGNRDKNTTCYDITIDNISDLPNMADLSAIRVCNLTDQITKALNRPCLFYEIVDGLHLEVRKAPTYDSAGRMSGTVGILNDVTPNRAWWRQELNKWEQQGKAFRIDGTNNYLILED
jgi:PAS domain-containing protein